MLQQAKIEIARLKENGLQNAINFDYHMGNTSFAEFIVEINKKELTFKYKNDVEAAVISNDYD